MRFTKRSLKKFASLYKKRFSEGLSREEAEKKAEYLLGIYAVVYDVSAWSYGDLLKKLTNNKNGLEKGTNTPQRRGD